MHFISALENTKIYMKTYIKIKIICSMYLADMQVTKHKREYVVKGWPVTGCYFVSNGKQ